MPIQEHQPVEKAAVRRRARLRPGRDPNAKGPDTLPAWPLVIAFVGFPLWWLLGLGDMAWPLFALFMFFLLVRTKRLRAPRGFGMWMLFLVWVLCSLVMLDEFVRFIGFTYRFSLYLAATVVFIYVYNARRQLTERRVFGILTVFWLIVVAGGYAGLLAPVWELKTPLAYILPQALLDNSYVHDMAFRQLTQFNPNPRAYVIAAPRPSAPFLYANGWGNVYSLLTPVAVVYMTMVRRGIKFWLLLLAMVISFVPAVLTLNRGMFLGLGIAMLYIGIRAALLGHGKILLALLGIAVVAGISYTVLPVQERIDQRTAKVESIDDRGNLYRETFTRTLESPLFGFGAPRPSERPDQPSVGTQGHVWMLMFSHGFVGLGLFLGWLGLLFLRTIRRTDLVGLLCNALLLVAFVEVFYYGILGAGLVIVMVAAALALREPETTGFGLEAPAVPIKGVRGGRKQVPARHPRTPSK